MHHSPGPLASLVLMAALGGCTDSPSESAVVCPALADPAIVVEIGDATTGMPIAAQARGAVQDAAYLDSLVPYGSLASGQLLSRQAGFERPGTYMVEVVAPNYLPWQQGPVVVARTVCGPATVSLTANLEPIP
jgi:hypothetical protein